VTDIKFFPEAVIPSNVKLMQQLSYANVSVAKINEFKTILIEAGSRINAGSWI